MAAIQTAGASEGTLGLITFAAILWAGLPRYGLLRSLVAATLAWFAVALAAWWLRETV